MKVFNLFCQFCCLELQMCINCVLFTSNSFYKQLWVWRRTDLMRLLTHYLCTSLKSISHTAKVISSCYRLLVENGELKLKAQVFNKPTCFDSVSVSVHKVCIRATKIRNRRLFNSFLPLCDTLLFLGCLVCFLVLKSAAPASEMSGFVDSFFASLKTLCETVLTIIWHK